MSDVLNLVTSRSGFSLLADLHRQTTDRREKFSRGGLAVQTLLIAVLISLVLFVWAIFALIKHGRDLPTWALVLGVVFLFLPPGPILTLILVYALVGRKKGSRKSSSGSRKRRKS